MNFDTMNDTTYNILKKIYKDAGYYIEERYHGEHFWARFPDRLSKSIALYDNHILSYYSTINENGDYGGMLSCSHFTAEKLKKIDSDAIYMIQKIKEKIKKERKKKIDEL